MKKTWQLTLVLVLLCLLPATLPGAGDKLTLTLGATVELARAGIKFRPFKGFANQPLPVPAVAFYRQVETGQMLETYDPRDLWLQDQVLAKFWAPAGTIQLAEIRNPYPDGLTLINNRHVLKADYEAARKKPADQEWSIEQIQSWMQQVVGKPLKIGKPAVNPALSKLVLRAEFAAEPGNRCSGYVLAFPAGNRRRLIFMLFQFSGQPVILNRDKGVAACLNSVTIIPPAAATANASSHFQERKWEKAPEKQTDEYRQARQRVLDSMKNLPDWWYVETPNYIITSNLAKDSRRFAKIIQNQLEIMRRHYEKFLPARIPVNAVSVVRIFKNRQEFQEYVGPECRDWHGVWMPDKKELVVSPVEVRDRDVVQEAYLNALYHEAFHQYLFYACGERNLPVWFDEGHAVLFEFSKLDHSGKHLKLQENRVALEQNQGLWENLQEPAWARFFALTHQEFYRNPERNYPLAWAAVYFLRRAAPLFPNRNYGKICDLVVDTCVADRVGSQTGIDAATVALLEQLDLKNFTRDFKKFWGSSTLRSKARRD